MDRNIAVSRSYGNVNFPLNQPSKPRHHLPPQTHLGWHARLRERVPDSRPMSARDVLIVMAGFMDEVGEVTLHIETLASACGGMSRNTFKRRTEKLSKLGELRIIPRRVARDYNAPNTYIINNHAAFRGGPAQGWTGKALKANTSTENIRPPAEAPVSPPPKPTPAKPRTRHIIASSRIASQFCADRTIGHWQRKWLTQRIEDRLNAGEDGDAIMADLERQHRSRSSGEGKPHRSTWRSHRDAMEARMAADIRTCRYNPPVTPAEVEAEFEKLAAEEVRLCIELATGPAQVRGDMLRCGQCTQAQIDEGFRLAAERIRAGMDCEIRCWSCGARFIAVKEEFPEGALAFECRSCAVMGEAPIAGSDFEKICEIINDANRDSMMSISGWR